MFTVSTRSELQETSYWTEDGERCVRENWYVVIEADNGQRWMLNHTFVGSVHKTEEGFYFSGSGKQQEADAEKVASRIRAAFDAGRQPDLQHWTEIDPCYGSQAYQELDRTGWFAYEEKRREMEGY